MRMIRAVAALGAALLTSAAEAQFIDDGYGERWRAPSERYEPYEAPDSFSDLRPLSVQEIRALLGRRGYQALSFEREAGDWVVEARDPEGRLLRLIVDAYDGRILRRSDVVPRPRAPQPRPQPRPAPPRAQPAPVAPVPAPAPAPPAVVPSEPAPPPPQAQSTPPRIIPLYNRPGESKPEP